MVCGGVRWCVCEREGVRERERERKKERESYVCGREELRVCLINSPIRSFRRSLNSVAL